MAQSIIRTKPISALVIHHTVVPEQEWSQAQTAASLNQNQYAYDGKPPYHFIIGNVWDYQGRPYNTIGYHAGSQQWNDVAIGIALTGNFQSDTPTAHQKKRLGEVIKELMRVYNIPRNRVFLHKEVRPAPTACPGAKITQAFISSLLTPTTMPTCEQNLAVANEEIRKLNTEIGRVTTERDTARTALAEEKRQHAETVKRADDNYKKWQDALDANGPLKQKIENAKNALA